MSTIIPGNLSWILDSKYLMVLFVIIGTWIVWYFVKNVTSLYEHRILATTSNDASLKIYFFFRGMFNYIVAFICFIIILRILDIDLTPLLAAGGIATIAISFAAQDVLGNFFSGAVLAADQPFHIGDRIEVQTYVGDVISIGPRCTRIQTLDNEIVTIPNLMLNNEIVTNYAKPDARIKVRIPVGVAYGTDISKVKKLLLEVASEVIESGMCLNSPPPSVYLLELGSSSLNLQMIVWAEQYYLIWDIQDFINSRILEVFSEEGIVIPFPQMDVHIDKQ